MVVVILVYGMHILYTWYALFHRGFWKDFGQGTVYITVIRVLYSIL